MNTITTVNWQYDTRPRTAALIAGFALLAMTVIAAFANFAVIVNLDVPDDPISTVANLEESADLVRLAAAGFIIIAILDVVIAWGMYIVLRRVNPSLSLLGGWLRLVYAAILAVAINSLLSALRAGAMDPTLGAFFLESFNSLWQIGLVIFGFHLCVIGVLAWQPDFMHWLLGILLFIAGLGYIVDGFGTVLVADYSLDLAIFTFIGEVVLIFWLFIRGRKLADQ